MRPIPSLLLAGLLIGGGAVHAAAQETIKAYTSDLPPWTNEGNMAKPGFALEVMREMAKRSGLKIDIEMIAWRRGQEEIKNTPNTMGFHLFRTPDREASYAWHFSILELKVSFVSMRKPVNSMEEAKAARVVVVAGTPQETEIKKAGAPNVEVVDKVEAAIRMLESGRVDAFYTIAERASYAWAEAGYPLDKLVVGKPQRTDQLFIASNKQMPAGSMEKLKAAFELDEGRRHLRRHREEVFRRTEEDIAKVRGGRRTAHAPAQVQIDIVGHRGADRLDVDIVHRPGDRTCGRPLQSQDRGGARRQDGLDG